MPDLRLDASGDIDTTFGMAHLTDDTTGETTAQLVRIALRLFLGEWFLDNRLGVDWFGKAFIKNPNLGAIESMIKAAILGVKGVQSILSYKQTFDRVNRQLTVSVSFQDDLQNILSVSEVIGQ